MNSRELLIETFNNEIRVAVLESNILVDLIIERENRSSIVGDIFMGRVEKILPNISAAFIDIGKNKSGFLPLLEHDREQKQEAHSDDNSKVRKSPPSHAFLRSVSGPKKLYGLGFFLDQTFRFRCI